VRPPAHQEFCPRVHRVARLWWRIRPAKVCKTAARQDFRDAGGGGGGQPAQAPVKAAEVKGEIGSVGELLRQAKLVGISDADVKAAQYNRDPQVALRQLLATAGQPAPAGSGGDPMPTAGWYRVDDGGAVAFRKSPDHTDRTDGIAAAGQLVYAAREPADHPGWVQTEEGLWVAKAYLLPLAAGERLTAVDAEAARVAHTAAADIAFGTAPAQPLPPPPVPPPLSAQKQLPDDFVPGVAAKPAAAAGAAGEVECADSDWKCSIWASSGECEKDEEFMSKSCRTSCGLCAGGKPPAAAGMDKDVERLYMAEAAALAGGGGGMAAAVATAVPPLPPPPTLTLTEPADGTVMYTAGEAGKADVVLLFATGIDLGSQGGQLSPAGASSVEACFDIWRSPLPPLPPGGRFDRETLWYDERTGSRYIADACFNKPQKLTASGSPIGNYMVTGAVIEKPAGTVLGNISTAVRFSVVEQVATQVTPTYEWAPVATWQSVPPGCDVKLPVGAAEGGERLVRIPMRWQLQVFLEPEIGFLRMEVGAGTTVGDVRTAAAVLASDHAVKKGWAEPGRRSALDQERPKWSLCGAAPAGKVDVLISDAAGMFRDDGETLAAVDLFGRRAGLMMRATDCDRAPALEKAAELELAEAQRKAQHAKVEAKAEAQAAATAAAEVAAAAAAAAGLMAAGAPAQAVQAVTEADVGQAGTAAEAAHKVAAQAAAQAEALAEEQRQLRELLVAETEGIAKAEAEAAAGSMEEAQAQARQETESATVAQVEAEGEERARKEAEAAAHAEAEWLRRRAETKAHAEAQAAAESAEQAQSDARGRAAAEAEAKAVAEAAAQVAAEVTARAEAEAQASVEARAAAVASLAAAQLAEEAEFEAAAKEKAMVEVEARARRLSDGLLEGRAAPATPAVPVALPSSGDLLAAGVAAAATDPEGHNAIGSIGLKQRRAVRDPCCRPQKTY
jgi:hypothetical protein